VVAAHAAFLQGCARVTAGEASGLPITPEFSAGEVEVAHALYRSAASGRFEKVDSPRL
jgi:hypothetical protein